MRYPRKLRWWYTVPFSLLLVLLPGRGQGQTPGTLVKELAFQGGVAPTTVISAGDKKVPQPCPECGGKGKTWVEPKGETCFACGGRGWFQRNADTKINCVYCGGKGTISRAGYWRQCARCGGRGNLPGSGDTPAPADQPPALKQEPLTSTGETQQPAAEPGKASVSVVDAATVTPPGTSNVAASSDEKKTAGLMGTTWTWSDYTLTFGDYGSLLARKSGGDVDGSKAATGTYFAADDLIEVDLEGRIVPGSWDGVTLVLDGIPATQADQAGATTPQPAAPVAPAPIPPTVPSPEPGLKVVPDKATVSLTGPQANFTVFFDGKPVPPAQISSVAIIGSYGWMFDVRKSEDTPGLVLLRALPDRAEAGTYDLLIRAHDQECRATVEVTVGVGPQDTQPPPASRGHETLTVNLPQMYREGQILVLDVTAEDPNRHYSWTANGQKVLEGIGESKLAYTFTRLGPHIIHLTEAKAGREILEWEGTTQVLPYPEGIVEVKARTQLRLTAPAGFNTYKWKVDGRAVQAGPEFSYTFKNKGLAKIECMMSDPVDQPYVSYYRAVWNATVK